MFKKNKRKKEYRYYRGKRKKRGGFWSKLNSKFLWVTIVFLTILLLIFAFSFYRKLSQPEAIEFGSSGKEQENTILVRIQILNACTDAFAIKGEDLTLKLAKRLEELSTGKENSIVYEMVKMEKCDFVSMGLEDSQVKESLIIDRIGNDKKDSPSQAALLTAKALGISPQNVIYKELKNNYQNIALTIVIGNDHKILFRQPYKT